MFFFVLWPDSMLKYFQRSLKSTKCLNNFSYERLSSMRDMSLCKLSVNMQFFLLLSIRARAPIFHSVNMDKVDKHSESLC